MCYAVNVRPHAATVSGVNRGTRSARPYTIFILWLCLIAACTPDASAAGCATPTFAPPAIYSAGAARSIAVADFNKDGKLDFAALNTGSSGSVSLYFGDGAGAFAPSGSLIPLGNSPVSIAAGDFDGDGFPDLVVANATYVEGEATVLLNRGLAFDVRRSISTSNASTEHNTANSVTVADVNLDGKLDVVLTDLAGGVRFSSNKVVVAIGDGTGFFPFGSSFQTSGGGSFPAHAVVRDFNGDGKPDLAVAHLGAGTGLVILTGDGTGNFTFGATTSAGGNSVSFIAPADFNSDNKVDLALQSGTPIPVLLGDGAGGFGAAIFNSTGGAGHGNLTTGDFNGDGNTDLATADRGAGSVLVMAGDGAGNLSPAAAYEAGASPDFITAADLNGDGKSDLLVAGELARSVSVLLNTCGTGNAAANLNFSAPVYAARDEKVSALTVTVNRYGSLAGAASVNYATSDGTAVSPLDYKAAAGTISFAGGEASKTFTVELADDTLDEPTETFNLTLSNPSGSAVLGTLSAATVNIFDDDPPPSLSISGASVTEGDGRATLTVTRAGDASGVASVDYRTADTDTFTVGCSDATGNNGGAYARCDFAAVVGRLDFAAGELQKTIDVPIIDDAHREGAETFQVVLSNPAGAGLSATTTATVTIQDNDAAGAANPIFTTPFFVRQHYLDFLSREPEAGEPWSGVLARCPNVNNLDPHSPSAGCDRILVSSSFFGSPEFRLKGFYAFRFYKLAFGRLPDYAEIATDMSFVAGATPEAVYARRRQLSELFIARPEFQTAYGGLSNGAFVSALLGRYQLAAINTPDPAQPDGTQKASLTGADLVGRLDANSLTRAQVFRAVADSDEVNAREFDNAFVAMQYYGYLRRKPDAAGYEAWLGVLRRGDTRLMVDGFINSPEYKLRFGGL
jgi:hypothetical protein